MGQQGSRPRRQPDEGIGGEGGDDWFSSPGSTGVSFTFDAGVLGALPTHARHIDRHFSMARNVKVDCHYDRGAPVGHGR